tara:strand:+ start:221 stop:469 length:249 start_codon:yes stop_codon:yes gene_type:complete
MRGAAAGALVKTYGPLTAGQLAQLLGRGRLISGRNNWALDRWRWTANSWRESVPAGAGPAPKIRDRWRWIRGPSWRDSFTSW